MTRMWIPTQYQSINADSLRIGQALSAQKANALIGNSGWLYEAYMDEPAPGNGALSITRSFDHGGHGSGRPLPIIMNQMRGLFLDSPDFNAPIAISGDDSEWAVGGLVNDFNFGHVPQGDAGWNWRRLAAIPVTLHTYGRYLRTRVQVRRTSGSGLAELRAVVYADEQARYLLGGGEAVAISTSAFTTVELVIDLDGLPFTRGQMPASLVFWGLRAWTPLGTEIEIRDTPQTAPCLAICSKGADA